MAPNLVHLSPQARQRAILERYHHTKTVLVRLLYASCGMLFLGVGIAGYVLPGLPGTVFLLIALWFFSQSHQKLYTWMLTNRFFGQQLVDYKAGLGIPRGVKYLIFACILGFAGLSIIRFDAVWLELGVGALAFVGIAYVATRPTRERVISETPRH